MTMASLFLACQQTTESSADAIYYGGDILTMRGETPEYTEAMAIKDGKIFFVGSKAEALKLKGDSTMLVDLNQRTLLPGFVDPHSHLWISGLQSLAANLLPAPDGEGNSIPALIDVTKEWVNNNQQAIGKVGWIVGFGYDDAQLAEHRHPLADELDKISTEFPVLFIHQSTHLGVMNHKGLEMANITANTPNPVGGVIRRIKGGQQPDGVLEEIAFFNAAYNFLKVFDPETNEAIAKAGLKNYAAFGFTTAQEGRATKSVVETWKMLKQEKRVVFGCCCLCGFRG